MLLIAPRPSLQSLTYSSTKQTACCKCLQQRSKAVAGYYVLKYVTSNSEAEGTTSRRGSRNQSQRTYGYLQKDVSLGLRTDLRREIDHNIISLIRTHYCLVCHQTGLLVDHYLLLVHNHPFPLYSRDTFH